MKTIATHPNPHLDDICGMWLLMRFHPRYARARIRFIPQGKKLPKGVVGIGIGRGIYDEHKGDVGEAAATLVWKDVKPYVKDRLTRAALEEIVQWVKDEDHAKFLGAQQHEYSVAITAMTIAKIPKCTSKSAMEWGMRALDGVQITMKEKQQLMRDWKKKKVFETEWGKGVALHTSVSSAQVGRMSMREGFVMFAVVNKDNGYRYIKSADPATRVDLTRAYKKAATQEPHAEWYLHHSKRMLICGSDVAQNKKLSSLSLDELIHVVRAEALTQ